MVFDGFWPIWMDFDGFVCWFIDFWLYLLGEHHGKNLEKMEWLIIIFPIHKGEFWFTIGAENHQEILGISGDWINNI